MLACLLAGLLLAAPASAGTGAELRGVIAKAEQLRGLKTTHPLAVSTLDAAGLRRVVAARAGARAAAAQRRRLGRRAAPARRAAGAGRASSRSSGASSPGRSPGCTCRAAGRLYVLGSGGAAPRSVIAHEVVHALQDEHFQLTRGAFAPRPRDHDGELAAQALVEGDATEVQSRYVAALSPGELVGELARTLGAVPRSPAGRVGAVPRARAAVPLHGGPGVRARTASARRAATARPRLPPPSAHDRRGARSRPATWPAIRRRGPCACPPGRYRFATTFGAEDLVALTGQDGLARSWLGGRMGVGRRGLELRLATRARRPRAAALERALPRDRGGRVPRADRVRPDPARQTLQYRAFPADRERRGAIPRAR